MSQITQMLIGAKGIEGVKEVLSESGFYIITSEEDKSLGDKGWRSERPKDDYDQLGIEIDYDYWK
jgi:hypothetical protein